MLYRQHYCIAYSFNGMPFRPLQLYTKTSLAEAVPWNAAVVTAPSLVTADLGPTLHSGNSVSGQHIIGQPEYGAPN